MENNSLVSVIMATYNDNPLYIEKSINSILNQTYKNIELLILDDSTNQETKNIIDSYIEDQRVHIYRESGKLGFVPSLNKGLKLAKGEYWKANPPNGWRRLIPVTMQVPPVPVDDFVAVYPLGGIRLLAFFTVRAPVAHPSVMFRRTIVDAGYQYNEAFLKAEDIDFWIRLYDAGYKFRNLPDTLLSFRVESDFYSKRVTNHEHEEYSLRARRMNFSWKKPFFSIIIFLLSYVRKLTPDGIKVKIYAKENGKNKK